LTSKKEAAITANVDIENVVAHRAIIAVVIASLLNSQV